MALPTFADSVEFAPVGRCGGCSAPVAVDGGATAGAVRCAGWRLYLSSWRGLRQPRSRSMCHAPVRFNRSPTRPTKGTESSEGAESVGDVDPCLGAFALFDDCCHGSVQRKDESRGARQWHARSCDGRGVPPVLVHRGQLVIGRDESHAHGHGTRNGSCKGGCIPNGRYGGSGIGSVMTLVRGINMSLHLPL